MSQRDSASRPLSRASSLSPRTVPPTSTAIPSTVPTIPSVRDELSLKLGREISEVSRPSNSGEGTSQLPRALGVHTILNPPDARGNVASIPPLSSASTGAEHLSAQASHGGAASAGNIQSQQPYAFYSYPQVSGTPPSGSPQTERSLPGFPGLDRGSPKAATPLPALNNPRAILSPRMTRVQSLHNPPGHKQSESMESPAPPSTIGIKRPYDDTLGPAAGGPHTRQPLPYTAAPPPPSIMLPSAAPGIQGGPLRSASQPVLAEHRTPTLQPSIPVQSYQSEGTPSNIAQLQHHPGQTPAAWDPRAGLGQPPVFGTGQSQTQDATGWSAGGSAVSGGAGRGRARARNDRTEAPPQQYLEINPPGGERYIVAVDTQIASKQADEKRQRNAGASARFRQRRKQQALEDKNKIMQLEEDKRGLEARLHEATRLIDFYRNERNRLRDIVLRTPGISESAHAGPRTPPNSALPLGFPDQAQMPRVPPPPPPANIPPSHGYASSETSSIERPTRRRRTDHTPDSGPLSYVPQPQAHSLPSISGPPYGMPPSRPPSASSTGEILPPIRGIEGSAAAHEPGVPPPPGPSAPYYSLNRMPYESGWAHRQGGPSEGGQR